MTALVLENVSVDFPLYGAHRSLRRVLIEKATGGIIRHDDGRDRVTIKALIDVTLDLRDGDRLGIVGHNGAGKTTLLRVMAGIFQPTRGRVFAEGRITPLFNTLPGLDPEDTGYENIVTAGMLAGMTRAEIEKKIPDIEEFSDLGEYLTLPLRSYSSGMVTRLGFSSATASEPGILLIDEGIGAGDARFAERATKRMTEFIGRSRIMALASHSNDLIRATCNKAVLMQKGQIIALGSVDTILAKYRNLIA